IEEFKQRVLNQPYGDVPHLLKPLAYKSHSYMWPTIGKDLSHIENATLDDVKAFFYNHYAPNNAIVAVTGNIEFKEAVQLAEKWFGPIPRRDIKVRAIAQEAPQTEARFLEVYKDVPLDALFKAYHMCSRTDADFNACDMLSDVLANGRSARLYQNLVQNKQLCSEVNAYISGDIDPGVIYVTAKPTPGNTLETINAAIEEELAMLSQELVDNDELEKVKNKFESNHLFSHIHYSNMASSLCFYELVCKAEDIDTEVLRYRATTPEQVQATARKVFAPTNCSTLFYKANK
ncbi:MAG: M16 family metallopeptidase, partial [Tannerellaceae bacterium]